MNILIVDDDQQITSYLQKGLQEEGYIVDTAFNGQDGLLCVRTKSYEVIILDWMLPKLSGIDICTIIRKNNIGTPILMLSAKGDIEDKIEGLNCGADDYLSKPFSYDELVARVNALVRRKKLQKDTILEVADLSFNITNREIKRGDVVITLTVKEYDLLELLMKNKGHLVSSKKISKFLWGEEDIESNIITVLIHHLRSKIDGKFDIKLIKTVRRLGYKIDDF
ncbi:MAG: DNA-binding response regulator [Arcobacter sp.]|nr:MAG: DNA-binding response regulator [Arcobacter sp.]